MTYDNTPILTLVPFTREHVDLTFQWVKDPELQKLFLIRGTPTWEQHKAYFENVIKDKNQRVYAVLLGGSHVGNGGIKNINKTQKEGELWVYIGFSSMRGKGIGKCATRLLICEAFENLRLQTIYVHVAKFNYVALQMYKKLGFMQSAEQRLPKEWCDRQDEIIQMILRRKI